MAPVLRTVLTEDLEREAELHHAVTALCEAAFGHPFPEVWERVGPGLHVLAEDRGRVTAHAMIVDRRVYLGHEADLALDAGYVENVAAAPDVRGQGHASAVMRQIGQLIGDEYALGALATTSNHFYERLGWETWSGPTSVRMLDGQRVRSADEDGHVMILRTPRTLADLDLSASIAVDWRAGRPW